VMLFHINRFDFSYSLCLLCIWYCIKVQRLWISFSCKTDRQLESLACLHNCKHLNSIVLFIFPFCT
jgi:hypothetical protein